MIVHGAPCTNDASGVKAKAAPAVGTANRAAKTKGESTPGNPAEGSRHCD